MEWYLVDAFGNRAGYTAWSLRPRVGEERGAMLRAGVAVCRYTTMMISGFYFVL